MRKEETKRCFILQSHLTSVSVLPGKTRKHKSRIFSLSDCITDLPNFNQSLLGFFNLADSQLIFTLI